MTVASRARALMTMRAKVERDQTATTNAWGGPDAPNFAALATIPCRVWSQRRQFHEDGDKTASIDEIRAIFPLDADVTEDDRLGQVEDRQGNVLWPGPLSIDTLQRKHTHLEARLEAIE